MKNKIIMLVGILLILICFGITILLFNNKTFFSNSYIGLNNKEIFIPKYSYFNREAGMVVASFYSLKSKNNLDKEISNYIEDFEYFENEHTFGYMKGDLFIQSYTVEDKGLYRKIYITYE